MIHPNSLEIHLLGPVEILFNQALLKIPRKVERAILYYLAAENRSISRTELIDLLWPQAEQIDPRGALRTALSRLRKRLPDANLIITKLDQVSLDTTRCDVDLLKFTESYQSLRGVLSALPKHKPLPIQIVNQIKDALGLWHGDTVIQGDGLSNYPEFDRWRQILGKDLNQQREYLLRRLADHYRNSGQLEFAIDLYIQLGRMNYLDSSSHLAVIEMLTTLGRHQEALEYCDALEAIFEHEFGSPLPDDVIKSCQYAQRLIQTSEKKGQTDWPFASSMHLPLVGRTNELEQLRHAYFSGGLVVLRGELGAGKTRLVQELFETLSPRPMLMVAKAREHEHALPFAPIIHGLRRHVPEKVLQEIDPVWAHALSLLLPELAKLREDCDPATVRQSISSRQHLLDALYHLLKLITHQYGRMLFFLDDAQWADHQTFQALAHLVAERFFDAEGVLIIAAHSKYPLREIDEIIDQFHHAHVVRVIDLPGLNPDELRSLTQLILNHPPSSSFVEQLYRETNGNLFMALEIIHHMLESSTSLDDLQNFDQLPLPESIHGLVRGRLNRLSSDARHILTCAALIGNDIPIELLQAVSGLNQQTFLNGLDLLTRSGFLYLNTISQVNEEHVQFAHEMMREVVISEASTAHRQILHQQIARSLSQETDLFDQSAVIADHYKASGDMAHGFEWLIKAAEHAWNLGVREDVLRAYQQAENILNRSPEGLFGIEDYVQLYHQWSIFAYQSSQVDLLEEIGVKLQQIGNVKFDNQLLGLSNLSLANACFLREDYKTGLVLIQKTIEDFKKTHNPEMMIRALFYQASFQWWTLDFDGMFATADQINNLLEGIPLEHPHKASLQFSAQVILVDAYYAQGEAVTALEIANQAYQAYFEQLGTFDRLRAYHMLTYSYYISGQFDQCIHYAQKGLKIAHALENPIAETLSLINLCQVEMEQGRLDAAFQHIAQAQKLAEDHHKIQHIVAANTLLGGIYDILHNTQQALHYFRVAQIRQGYFFQSYYGLQNNIRLARLLTRSDQPAEAREILGTTLEVTEQKGVMLVYIQALIADGLMDLDEEAFFTAEDKFVTAVAMAEQRGLVQEVLWGKFRLAQMAYLQQRFDQTEEFLLEILAFTEVRAMKMLNKNALELAFKLAKHKTLPISPDELRSAYLDLIAEIEVHTQSEPLRQDFLNAKRIWLEAGGFH